VISLWLNNEESRAVCPFRSLCWVLLALTLFQPFSPLQAAVVTGVTAGVPESKIKSGEQIALRVGETVLLTADSIIRVAIGNGQLAEVHLLKDQGQILLIGTAAGTTDLRVWDRTGRHTHYALLVGAASTLSEMSQIRAILSGISSLSLREADGTLVVEGTLSDAHEIRLLEQLEKRFPMLVNRTRSVSQARLEEMVLLDVKVVEMHRRSLNSIGVRWDRIFSGPNVSVSEGVVRTGLTSFLTSDLRLLEDKGAARILAEPRLLARSGFRAEFLAGGEVPLPVTIDGQTTVIFKDYGIILNMEPIVHDEGFISTQVEIEVSNIDPAVQVMGIPGFQTRKTNTSMNARSGQTLVLSGLLSRHDSKSVSRIPLLASLPILGELFKSRDFLNEETELVVFVTPSLVNPSEEAELFDLSRVERLQKESEEAIRFDILD
jgi:pilus assembly protein CpaC